MAIALRSVHGFFVGGEKLRLQGLAVEQHRFAQNGPARAVDPNGDTIAGQMYVQAFLQQEPRFACPLVLWHGGGMTGANWDSRPDGQSGWLNYFLHQGWDVYVCDAVERGRSSWARWPDIYAGPALHRTLDEGWTMFRIGPPGSYHHEASQRTSHVGQQFPVDCFDSFAAQWVPRWANHEAMTMAAYALLLKRIGTCALLGHSQGGGFALQAAQRWPEHIRAVIALEPSGAPALPSSPTALPPHLVVWGDFFDAHPIWQSYRKAVTQYGDGLRHAGASWHELDLPAQGIVGNSHFPMMDRNADQVAALLQQWLASQIQAR